MRFPTMWYVRPAKFLENSMTVKLLTEQHLEFVSVKGGCRGSSESTFVKMPYCWKSHVAAQMAFCWRVDFGPTLNSGLVAL